MPENRLPRISKNGLIGLIVLCCLVSGTGIWQMCLLGRMADRCARKALLMQTLTVAQAISPDQVRALSFTAEDQESPLFRRVAWQLATTAEHLGLVGLYTVALREGHFVFGPESFPQGHPLSSPPGTPYRQPPPQVAQAFASRQPKVTPLYTDEYGTSVSSFVPVIDPRTGNVLLLVGADLSVSQWKTQIRNARLVPLSFSVLVLVLLVTGFAVIHRRSRLTSPASWGLRYAEAFLCAAVMLTLTVATVWRIRYGESCLRELSFATLAHQHASAIRQELDSIRNQLDALSRLFSSSEAVTRQEFRNDASLFYAGNTIQSTLWLPAVAADDAARFEAHARSAGLDDFRIWQFDRQGKRVSAQGRPAFYPALYIEPQNGDGHALGFDFGSDPTCASALQETLRGGLISATGPVRFFAQTNQPPRLLAFRTAASQTQTGLVAIAVSLKSLATVPMNREPRPDRGLLADLFELAPGEQPRFLATSAPSHGSTSSCWNAHNENFRLKAPVFCFGKTYAVVIRASPDWLDANPIGDNVTAGIAGLMLTALLTVLVVLLSNRRISLEREVQKRTADLRSAHDNLKEVFGATPVAMLIVDGDARVLDANQRAEQLFLSKACGCRHEGCGVFLNCVKRHDAPGGCGHGPDCAACPLRRAIREVAAGAASVYDQDLETRIDRSGKTESFHLRFSLAPVLFESRRRVVVTLNDITAWRRAEQLYRTLFREMDYGIALYEQVTDRAGRIVDFRFTTVNPAYERITGLAADTVTGKTLLAVRPDLPADLFATYARVAECGQAGRYSFHDRTRNRHYEGALFRFESGLLANIFTDVTDRIQAEERASRAAEETLHLLRETEAARSDLLCAVEEQKRTDEALVHERNLLYALMDNLPDRIYFKDTECRFLKISKAHAASLGLSTPEEAIGKSDADFKSAEEAARTREKEREIIRTGLPLLAQVEQKLTSDGRPRWVSASKAPIKDNAGQVVGLVGISRDITQEIELQQALQQASKMDAIGRLAGGVAHDFNNLLQAILGFTEILLSGVGEQDAQYGDLKQIERAAKRAADLTRQLLTFSRKQRVEPRMLDLNQIIVSTEKMLRRLMGENIAIVLQLAPDVQPVCSDPNQIEQILMNLAVNAKDAMPQGGRLTFSTDTVALQATDATLFPESSPGRFTCLSVSDTGTGLSNEMRQHLFEPFFTTKAQGKGTGLGLSVIYGIVKQNGGWINVYSEEGLGTTFKIYLPAHDRKPENADDDDPSQNLLSLQGLGKSILLVEDEPGVRSLSTLVLQGTGYRVIACESALTAKAIFERENGRFDLLFSDVVLVGQNGIDLALELRAKRPDLSVLLCSGYADDSVRWQAIQQEGFHFLPKPYPTVKLLTSVRDAINTQPAPATGEPPNEDKPA